MENDFDYVCFNRFNFLYMKKMKNLDPPFCTTVQMIHCTCSIKFEVKKRMHSHDQRKQKQEQENLTKQMSYRTIFFFVLSQHHYTHARKHSQVNMLHLNCVTGLQWKFPLKKATWWQVVMHVLSTYKKVSLHVLKSHCFDDMIWFDLIHK